MMSTLDANGISLGYTEVSEPTDDITVPAGAINGIIFNLALVLAQGFDEMATQDLRGNAKVGLSAMRKLAINILPTSKPCTLPLGSGNEGDFIANDHFYPCSSDEILTEDNGSILLESDT